MISCLILGHPTITNLTKCKLLRFIFHEDEYEIQVIQKNTIVIYLWNVEKVKVWQTVANFESTEVLVGYGFGKRKNEAYDAANTLLRRMF